MNILASDSGSIQKAVREGRECTMHCITETDRQLYGRPRAELDPDQNFHIGDRVAYNFDVLIPADLQPYDKDWKWLQTPIMCYRQLGATQPAVPFSLNLMGDHIQGTGYTVDNKWFTVINRMYAPEVWMSWRIEMLWDTLMGEAQTEIHSRFLLKHFGGETVTDDHRAQP